MATSKPEDSESEVNAHPAPCSSSLTVTLPQTELSL